MAWTLTFTPYGGAESTIYVNGTTTDKTFQGEDGFGPPDHDAIIDPIPTQLENVDRGVFWKERVYVVTFRLLASSLSGLETLQNTWDSAHDAYAGVGVVKRVTAGGNTRYLNARPGKTTYGAREGFTKLVTQEYVAANPWWYAAVSSDSTAFNGATPVTKSLTNGGTIPTPPVWVITGVIEKPKIATANGSYGEINTTPANNDDTLTLDLRPGNFAVLYREHGAGAGTNWYPYRTSASDFGQNVWLPKGANNVTLSATSGTAAVAVTWYNRYGGLS